MLAEIEFISAGETSEGIGSLTHDPILGHERQVLMRNRFPGESSLDSPPIACQNPTNRTSPHTLNDARPMDSHAAPIASDDVFQAADVAQFTADDTEAGRAICQMLSLFFTYTVFAMTIAALVTVYWTSH